MILHSSNAECCIVAEIYKCALFQRKNVSLPPYCAALSQRKNGARRKQDKKGADFPTGAYKWYVTKEKRKPAAVLRPLSLRPPIPTEKRCKTQARQGAVSTLQGAYIDVRDRKGTERQHSIAPRILRFLPVLLFERLILHIIIKGKVLFFKGCRR